MPKIQDIILKYKLYLLPILTLCLYCLNKSFVFNLHDFGNSYFPALMLYDGQSPEKIVFDIYDFNLFAWQKGYNEALLDYYLNSPFSATFLYPFVYFKNAYSAKLFFNIISIILFILSIEILSKYIEKKNRLLIGLLPILFFIPIQNNILFGQFYLIIFAFTIFAFHFYFKKNSLFSAIFLSFAILTKVFPIFYGFSLLINSKRRDFLYFFLSCLLLFLISIFISGFSFWNIYLFDQLPTAFLNESTIGFQFNVQSFDVFFKYLFFKDSFYNPNPILDNIFLFYLSIFLVKSLILGVTISFVNSHKTEVWKSLSCIIIALFLLQSRTASYSTVLWIIPMFVFISHSNSVVYKIIFCILLFFAFNFSYVRLPFFFQFSRLWLSLFLFVFLFEKSFFLPQNNIINTQFFVKFIRLNVQFFILAFMIFLPILLKGLFADFSDNSKYVLPNKGQFITYDFKVENGKLVVFDLSKNGKEKLITNIAVSSFDTLSCKIKNNQIYLNQQLIALPNSLKKKAVLVNQSEIYFLTDHHSRFGWFTLKKIKIND
ncbi:glycosyltransferase family 87 protein [Emticicia sp. SJ17W-69]|uniref:glycosyltransferase family 87 protein n=1 Tax=Emticicia sp. SJ17W-69 TaxID=3421657 RepID=UPI003EBC000C